MARFVSLVLLGAGGCVGGKPDDTPAETGGTDSAAPVPCDAPATFTVAQRWEAVELFPSPSAEFGSWPGSKGPGVAVTDLDGDGWLDVVHATPYAPSVVLHNDGTGRLAVDTTAAVGEGPLPAAVAVAAADLDGDGDPDLAFAGAAGADDVVLRNEGGLRFTAVVLPGSTGESKTASFGDADGDGDLDLYIVGNTFSPNPREMEAGTQDGDGNQLWIQQDDGAWVDETAARFPAQARDGLGYQGSWLDHDADGDLDLYVTYDWGSQVLANQLFANDGTGHFTDVGHALAVDKEISGMGAAVGDADGDGLPDLFLTDLETVWLLVNRGDTFVDYTTVYGLVHADGDGSSWGASFFDADRDGRTDVAAVYGVPEDRGGAKAARSAVDALWRGGRDEADQPVFTDVGAETGFADTARSRAMALGDLDRDGRVDVVRAGEWFVETVLASGGCPPGATVRFAGPPGNRDGIGARVELRTDAGSTWSWNLPSTTYSSSAPELTLPVSDALTSIVVTWPDGATTTLPAPTSGELLTAVYP